MSNDKGVHTWFNKKDFAVLRNNLHRFRGENAHAHEVDVIVQVAEGEISANGRFASGGRVKMGEIV
jgi:hypothetical protein